MIKFLVVPEQDWSVLKKYLDAADEGIVLLPEPTMKQMPQSVQEYLNNLHDTELVQYHFENASAPKIDLITLPDNYTVQKLTNQS